MKLALTGASGFIGRPFLYDCVRRGHEVTALGRDPESISDLPCKKLRWSATEVQTQEEEKTLARSLSGLEAVVHLAGAPVGEARWSPEVKKQILESRIYGTRNIVQALAALPADQRPKTLICASAIGFYGSRGDELLSEESTAGNGFLADVVQKWEKEAHAATEFGVRVVLMRVGVVLGADGGALRKMKAVVLGSGRQWMSWVHRDDVISFVEFALSESSLSGVYNIVSPEPAQNSQFTKHFAEATGSLLTLSAPEWAVRSAMGEMAGIVFDSTRVSPARTLASGFQFRFKDLPAALREIFPPEHRTDRRFSATQFIARPLNEVFDFFSRAENLETITPPWLNFKITGTSTSEVKDQTLIDYTLKIHGLPVRWRSRIENWVPNEKFVDTQLKGPYSKWHHTHTFEAVPGGTLIHDLVFYRLPMGTLGETFAGAFVRKDVETIFSYRKTKIREIFS